MTEHVPHTTRFGRLHGTAAWVGVGICVLFGVYAVGVVFFEGLRYLNDGQSDRSAPSLFLAHALTGGIALIAGALQLRLARSLLRTRPQMHRYIGRTYVTTAVVTAAATPPVIAGFDVPVLAKIAFMFEAVLWFGATAAAFFKIRSLHVAEHREWMIRSYALALFFVTGGVWLDVFKGSELYPLGVFLSWAPNLLGAEWWIRRTRVATKRELRAGRLDPEAAA